MDKEDSFKLLLFDIDGTLIRSAGAGRAALERSFQIIYGIKDGFHDIHMMGRTDPGILKEAFMNHGLEWREDQVARFKEAYFQFLKEEIEVPREGKRTCPGIPTLLSLLRDRSDLILGLLTGNWRTSSLIKLRYFGLDGFFNIGAFGDDSSFREELVPIVLERIEKKLRVRLAKEGVYVIGDTPLDIQCAKPHGVRTVGVATGFHTIEQIAHEKPDFLFENFEDTEKVIEVFR